MSESLEDRIAELERDLLKAVAALEVRLIVLESRTVTTLPQQYVLPMPPYHSWT